MIGTKRIVVAKDGSGDFETIQKAVDSISQASEERVVIVVKEGEYREKLVVDRPNVALIGAGADKTFIRWDDYARKTFPDGELYHTFNSYTALIGGDDFACEGITFANDAGPGDRVGQAIAAYVDGDRATFRRCRFLGWQDTLFTGPLPPNPLDRATFGGPREGKPLRPSRQYYEDCYIEGDIDFIFGSATAVFYRCEIRSKGGEKPSKEAGERTYGWVTAASTPADSAYGYVFLECRLTGETPPGTVYLGRPWRERAKVAFIRCELGEHIHPAGWEDWSGRGEAGGVVFSEYENEGLGAASENGRVGWSLALTKESAEDLAPPSCWPAPTDGTLY